MLTPEKRQEMVEKLNQETAETIQEWVLRDWESLLDYVHNAEGYDELDDDTLIGIYEVTFGNVVEDEQDCC